MLAVKFVVALVACCSLGLATSARAASPLTGEMKALDGKPVDLAAYQGKVVLVVDVASGKAVAELNADQPFIPASVAKVPTTGN